MDRNLKKNGEEFDLPILGGTRQSTRKMRRAVQQAEELKKKKGKEGPQRQRILEGEEGGEECDCIDNSSIADNKLSESDAAAKIRSKRLKKEGSPPPKKRVRGGGIHKERPVIEEKSLLLRLKRSRVRELRNRRRKRWE